MFCSEYERIQSHRWTKCYLWFNVNLSFQGITKPTILNLKSSSIHFTKWRHFCNGLIFFSISLQVMDNLRPKWAGSSSTIVRPESNFIKLFCSIIDTLAWKASVFGVCKHFQTSLIFEATRVEQIKCSNHPASTRIVRLGKEW